MHTCDAHVVAVEGVRQAVGHDGVLQGGVAHPHADPHWQRAIYRDQRFLLLSSSPPLLSSSSPRVVTYPAHALHAARHHHSRLPGLDGLSSQTHGLQPRATHHLAAPGRDGVGDACPDAGLPRRVLPLTSRPQREGTRWSRGNRKRDLCRTFIHTFELSPAVRTCPMMTSETSSGFTAARFRTSLITTEQSSGRGTVDRAPFKDPG
ncbi:hypothetical protein EYF80_025326 [Liparis tanakae]|uniref:Uncharacterized protein n=1 Tax=Liparis tanakae TaxID=230148 RepID=A0A4Z2HGU5_9TELE|nr:hypothetical protein EYF80_025326 [Liparis tanakae]